MSFKEEISDDQGLVTVYCFPEIGHCPSPKNGSASGEAPFLRSSFGADGLTGKGCHTVGQGRVDLVGIAPGFAKEIETKAYHQGYCEGEKAGMEVARKEVTPKIRDLDDALRELEKIKKQISSTIEKEALVLALAVAKKIVRHEMRTNGDAIVQVVKEALGKVVDDSKIKVRIHPSQIDTIEKARSQFAGLVQKTEAIVFESDEDLTPGGCLIETNFGEIDARIETQFQVIEEAFDTQFQNVHQNE